jgi:hypothetical protein
MEKSWSACPPLIHHEQTSAQMDFGCNCPARGILFLTNPDQTMHLKAINEAVELRFPNTPYGSSYTRMTSVIQDYNYGLFSTTGFADMTFSCGFLGRVQTTNEISYVATGVLPR